MNTKPKIGDKLFVTKLDGSNETFIALVTAVGYRFFTVESSGPHIAIQFRLGNWAQRTFTKPDFTVSRTAP